jgi:hypothetical protein
VIVETPFGVVLWTPVLTILGWNHPLFDNFGVYFCQTHRCTDAQTDTLLIVFTLEETEYYSFSINCRLLVVIPN